MAEVNTHGMSQDEIRLAKLGYQQTLKRQFSAFQNFGFVLSNASVIIGVIPLYTFAMTMGGPLALTFGWLIVLSFVMCIGLCMAEICSTYPTAGGLYYQAAKLGGPKWGPIFSWFEAWFNCMGQVAGASGSVLAAAQLLASMYSLTHDDVAVSAEATFGIFCVLVITGALMNCIGGIALKFTSIFSVWVHMLGTVVIVAVLLATSTHKNSAKFAFTEFHDESGYTANGFPRGFVFLLGLLPSQWSMLGYDSSAHMSEETENSYINGPRGIVYTIVAAGIMGWALILGMNFCIDDIGAAIASGNAAAYVFKQSAGINGALVLLAIVVSCGWCCGIGTMAANSRAFYAFARDGGLPKSKFWTKLDTRTGMPLRLIWFSAFLVIILALPSMFSPQALSAVSGISIIGFTVSYAIPVFLRITIGRKYFVQSEFNLGRWSTLLGSIGCAWTALAFVLFNLPQAWPVEAKALNYTPVAVGFMLVFAGTWWILSARKWFKGPVSDLDNASSKASEATLNAFPADDKKHVQ
ncbi:amino acid/polyamine transporter I [Phlyctochytrium arcticum]|nr:amino acid/polyamine transporter I [Phlyctochytrium arcticum]